MFNVDSTRERCNLYVRLKVRTWDKAECTRAISSNVSQAATKKKHANGCRAQNDVDEQDVIYQLQMILDLRTPSVMT
jgi:hypothetical protein